MAFSCGFYDAINNDRVYSATQFGEMFDGLITDGVYATVGHALAVVSGSGVQVKVRSGRAWFNKTWSVNTADLPLDLELPDLLFPRIDAVILEVDTRNPVRNNSIKVITGEPNINPTKPTLIRVDGLYQYPLAWVTVDQNASVIAESKIENNIGLTPTPFVTGILESVSIDELWDQWEGQFDEWFENIKTQLSGDIAVNLQRQIEELKTSKLNVSDKASSTDITKGTSGKWIDAEGLKESVDVLEPLSIITNPSPTSIPLDGRLYNLSSEIGQKIYNKFGYLGGAFSSYITMLNTTMDTNKALRIFDGTRLSDVSYKYANYSEMYYDTISSIDSTSYAQYNNGSRSIPLSKISYAIYWNGSSIIFTYGTKDSSNFPELNKAILCRVNSSLVSSFEKRDVNPLSEPVSYSTKYFCGYYATDNLIYVPILYRFSNKNTISIYTHKFQRTSTTISYVGFESFDMAFDMGSHSLDPFVLGNILYITGSKYNTKIKIAFDLISQMTSTINEKIDYALDFYIRGIDGIVRSNRLYSIECLSYQNNKNVFGWIDLSQLGVNTNTSYVCNLCVLTEKNGDVDFKKYPILVPKHIVYYSGIGDITSWCNYFTLTLLGDVFVIYLYQTNSGYDENIADKLTYPFYTVFISPKNPENVLHTFTRFAKFWSSNTKTSYLKNIGIQFGEYMGIPIANNENFLSTFIYDSQTYSVYYNRLFGSFTNVKIPDVTDEGRNPCMLYLKN